ncbi:hypothetical protein EAH78_18190 [Pseudomonas arsenicoxydans]|uniref:Uncharacterized protein n=2 Tax=Pseudomonas arsenicoxydans TaxID=702115 RepID=A0A502HR40_9PSED|nr:hypothetical protein EAH78_18190 [Pseudomonas arsenicoxydans]
MVTGVQVTNKSKPGSTPRVGDTLEANVIGFNDADGDAYSGASYSWLLNGASTGNTSSTYTTVTAGSVVVKATPETDPAKTDPNKGATVTSPAVIVLAAGANVGDFFIGPLAATWSAADAYCNNAGARLPTQIELQELFVNATSATIANGSQTNTEMCSVHGWPLSQLCGGIDSLYRSSTPATTGRHFSVFLNNGSAPSNADWSDDTVACYRKAP